MIFTGNNQTDYIAICTLIDSYAKANKIKINYDENKVFAIVNQLGVDFPCVDGLENSNVFKKAARFLCDFISERPISSSLGILDEDIKKISNYPNAVIGFHVVIVFLRGATVGGKTVDSPIQLSKHSYIDIINALSNISGIHFFLVTVLLEQLVYKSNGGLQDTLFDL
ncbi:hypothetical protein [uncultured Gammaproteobacteria bacterium]|jgi:hypothetical protein|nr:hypothetical protein [uncultured Gammaproteobacteria bacterium]CAC9612797.1 hypothetical protein [uncultured Gammaproteobacteria bacterium]CAC9981563.1 hypothetical protein [uncultured Gammaproteobacteria bacterium]